MGNSLEATNVLRQEHQTILKALGVLDAVCNRLSQGEKIPSDHLRTLMNFILEFSDAHHHGKEEDVLLPYLEQVGIPRTEAHLTELLDEHILQRAYVESMCEALAHTYSLASEEATQHFIKQARNLIGLLSEHILKEDTVLIPQAERLFSATQQQEIFKAFRKNEIQKGTAQRIQSLCTQIEALEKVYLPLKTKTTCCGCGMN